jgi:hypothetical protein
VTDIRLVCYPDVDPLFTADAALAMRVELPFGHLPTSVLPDVLDSLRKSYPLVAIRVEPRVDGSPETWHVYRDGLPELPA